MSDKNGSDNGYHTELLTITPKEAKEFLANSSNLRGLNVRYVNRLAGAIRRGEWVTNGESIKFNANDKLIDGQHRLHAIILADTAIQTMVMHGVANALTVDTGLPRKLAQVMKGLGWKDCGQLAAAVRIDLDVTRGLDPFHASVETVATLAQQVTHLRSMKKDRLLEARTIADAFKSLPGGVATAVFYRCLGLDHELAKKFGKQLATGESLHAKDPAFMLRRFALNGHAKRQFATSQGRRVAYGIMVKSWNALRGKYQLNQMVIMRNEEALPEIE